MKNIVKKICLFFTLGITLDSSLFAAQKEVNPDLYNALMMAHSTLSTTNIDSAREKFRNLSEPSAKAPYTKMAYRVYWCFRSQGKENIDPAFNMKDIIFFDHGAWNFDFREVPHGTPDTDLQMIIDLFFAMQESRIIDLFFPIQGSKNRNLLLLAVELYASSRYGHRKTIFALREILKQDEELANNLNVIFQSLGCLNQPRITSPSLRNGSLAFCNLLSMPISFPLTGLSYLHVEGIESVCGFVKDYYGPDGHTQLAIGYDSKN
jgi:hypothetical protein